MLDSDINIPGLWRLQHVNKHLQSKRVRHRTTPFVDFKSCGETYPSIIFRESQMRELLINHGPSASRAELVQTGRRMDAKAELATQGINKVTGHPCMMSQIRLVIYNISLSIEFQQPKFFIHSKSPKTCQKY